MGRAFQAVGTTWRSEPSQTIEEESLALSRWIRGSLGVQAGEGHFSPSTQHSLGQETVPQISVSAKDHLLLWDPGREENSLT